MAHVTMKEIYALLDQRAPFSSQLDFDNSGFLVGRWEAQIERVLVALDVTPEVIDEAKELGAQAILAHHPVIWTAPKSVTDQSVLGRKLLSLMENGISVVCAHTNLDAAQGGVNDVLASILGIEEIELLKVYGTYQDGTPYGIERVGRLPGGGVPLEKFAALVKERLGSNGVRYSDAGRLVERVAVGGGSCSFSIGDVAAAGCDTFVTGDVKYDGFLDAKAMGLNIVDAGHFPTENVVCPVLVRWLREAFPGLEVIQSGRHQEICRCL